MARRITRTLLAFAGAMLLSTAAYAQSAIVGVVKDSSGAAMPGVTVEAASDVLIEKVKSAISDGDGAYRIADLRPGTYIVTFTLTGFKTFRRDGLELPSEFTATLNAELGVGSLEETITVTGASPVVDVTSTAKTAVLNREAIDLIPTGRSIQGLAQLVVGVSLSLPDTGGARAMQQTYMSTHGMTTANTTVLVDGQMTNGLQGDGAIQSYYNDAMNAEMSYQTAAIGAETSSGGVRLNMIPREGGNQFHGDFKFAQRPGRVAVEQPDRSPPGARASRPATPSTASSTTPRRSAARSRRTSCGSSPRRATSRSTTSSPTPSWTTAARASTTSSSRTAWRA